LVLPAGVKLKYFLEGPAAAGACRLESGPDDLIVHAQCNGDEGNGSGGVGVGHFTPALINEGDGNGGGGGCNFDPALNHKIKIFLQKIPGRCVDGKYFMRKWLEMHGVPFGWLPPGVKLKNYLEGPQAAGACRLEMRKISNGEMILMVHAPGGEQGGAPPANTSVDDATLTPGQKVKAQGNPIICFDGFRDEVSIPFEDTRRLVADASPKPQPAPKPRPIVTSSPYQPRSGHTTAGNARAEVTASNGAEAAENIRSWSELTPEFLTNR